MLEWPRFAAQKKDARFWARVGDMIDAINSHLKRGKPAW
jgi:hypothetical protein